MVLLVLLVLALFVVQTLLPGRFREPAADGAKGKLIENLGNRDHMRPLTVVGERATRALANMHEALPVFLALALMNMIVGTAAGMAVTGATHLPHRARRCTSGIYMAGVPVVRTLVWAVGWVGLGDDDRAAARQDLSENEKPPALFGPEASLPLAILAESGLGSPALFRLGRRRCGFFICSRISLRSSFICLVSSGRISLMKHRSRPTMTFSNCRRCWPWT